MPAKNMSSKIGKSSSPVIQRVIQKNVNVQAPVKSTATAYNKQSTHK